MNIFGFLRLSCPLDDIQGTGTQVHAYSSILGVLEHTHGNRNPMKNVILLRRTLDQVCAVSF
ncbi:hypothetical protein CBD41_02220 [bacterium TMED181]|nr:hypothetical protein [Planctomycetota bacterium]OUW46741.1 MAG: hypothetical protein CBD41_02220 [bacterium TMED181]